LAAIPAFWRGPDLLDGDVAQLYSHRANMPRSWISPAAEPHSYLYFPYPPFVAHHTRCWP
jgi:hypothetical protein